MKKETTIELGDHFEKFIQSQIETGRFTSPSEVVKSGLKLLEQEDQKQELIKKALAKGESSGIPKAFNNQKFKAEMRKKFSE